MSKGMSGQAESAERVSRPVEARLDDLRNDVDAAMDVVEARTGFPRIDDITPGTLSEADNAIAVVLTGTGFDGQGRAKITVDPKDDANQNGFTLVALEPGEDGNLLSLELTIGVGGGETVTLDGNAVKVEMRAGGADAGEIIAAINNAASGAKAKVMALAEINNGGTGATHFKALAATRLTGGKGKSDFSLIAGGEAAVQNTADNYVGVASDTNVEFTLDGTALSGAQGDLVVVHVVIGGMYSSLSMIIAA